jgi:hypothetical protein
LRIICKEDDVCVLLVTNKKFPVCKIDACVSFVKKMFCILRAKRCSSIA